MKLRCHVLLIVFWLMPLWATAGDFQGIILQNQSREFFQGNAISGRIADTTDARYTVRLEHPGGKTVAQVPSMTHNESVLFLLPLQFDIEPGHYLVRAISHDPQAIQLDAIDITIHNRDFPQQEIPLTREVSNLRRSVDPRREEESAALWAILTDVSEDGYYHFGSMTAPLDVEYRTTSEFAHQRVFLYDDGSTARSIHWGWDLAAPTGTPVQAPAGGRIRLAQDRMITGYSIVMEHLPGVYSLLYHLDSLHVAEGEIVQQGDTLGTVGSTGVSTGPHLHWEIRIAAIPVQPISFLERPLLDIAGLFPHN